MKLRLLLAICLLVISVGTAVFCLAHLNRCTDALTEAIETAMRCAATESTQWAPATGEVERLWERHKEFLHILLPHINLNELEWALGALGEYQKQGDVPLYIEQCVRGLQCVNTVREMERPNWGNIF